MASIGISDVTASVYSEKTRLKKLMKIIITIMKKSQVDFKFDALYLVSLHREPPEVGLVEKLTGSLYWWVEQCVPTLHRKLPYS